MAFTVEKIEVGRIYLANDNPRHDPIETEAEIIQHLIAHERVKPLARHIADAGQTSPLERIAVYEHPKVKGAFVAAEGNRRLCALKLLYDPDKADTEANKRYFRGLAASMGSKPSKIEAVVFQTKADARPWMTLRHEGEQGGVGTRGWGPEAKARFNAQGDKGQNPNIQALKLIDYARKQKLLSPQNLDSISITTITRFLSNPVFRDTLGLSDSKSLQISVPPREFNQVVARFLTDAMTPDSGVNSRTNVEDRKNYANKLRREGVAPTTRIPDPIDAMSVPSPQKGKSAGAEKGSASGRNNRSPDDRKHIIPGNFVAHISDKILKRLYDELKALDAEAYPFAGTYLLRAVLEQLATVFLRQHGKKWDDQELHPKLARVADLLHDTYGKSDRDLKFLRTMSTDRDSRYSPSTLGHFIHGGAVPTHTNAIRMWDSLEPIIAHMFNNLNQDGMAK